MKFTLFLSDLHLSPSTPQLTQRFFKLLEDTRGTAETLYLLGDIFEVWVGDDELTPLHREVARRLQQLSDEGVAIYFMHGNRDFMVGPRYAKQCGMTLLPDPTVINLNGNRILLTHGDLLCTLDKGYNRYRKFVHNPWMQRQFLKLPLSLRQRVARRLRHSNNRQASHYTPEMMNISQDTLKQYYERYDIKQLIHGHTHLPGVHLTQCDGQLYKRWVLGSWEDSSFYLSLRNA